MSRSARKIASAAGGMEKADEAGEGERERATLEMFLKMPIKMDQIMAAIVLGLPL